MKEELGLPILVSTSRLPGYRYVGVPPHDGEEIRREINDPKGTYIGTIAYVRRQRSGQSSYGWVPAAGKGHRLTSQVEAVEKVIDRHNRISGV